MLHLVPGRKQLGVWRASLGAALGPSGPSHKHIWDRPEAEPEASDAGAPTSSARDSSHSCYLRLHRGPRAIERRRRQKPKLALRTSHLGTWVRAKNARQLCFSLA